jgi:hypothetical protein
MYEKIIYALIALAVICGIYFYDDIFGALTDPDVQVDIAREMGVIRQSEQRGANP